MNGSDHDFPVIGIGASAGGLKAYQQLLAALPADCGAALVLVQHLDPHHASHLPALLGRGTALPVRQAEEGQVLEPNHIYIIPPGKFLSVGEGRLHLEPPVHERGARLSIDHFFRSLAAHYGPRAVAVVLSGTGSDGAHGIREVKAQGGLVLVQDPADAEYDGMPRSAVNTGVADLVAPVEILARQLLSWPLALVPADTAPGPDPALPAALSAEYHRILGILRREYGHDFSDYRSSTLVRRILRRMALLQVEAADYVALLEREPDERQQLLGDVLIGVTRFFRDPGAWEALADELDTLLQTGKGEREVRAWVPGCATGQEAYSLAIAFTEAAERCGVTLRLQVFGSDIDENALNVARRGSYPADIREEVGEARLERFFVAEEGGGYRVNKGLRESVMFARQNLIGDPPFSQLDLITCRNLLIYFEPSLQQRAFGLFHFSLRPGGLLFLGSSEAIGRGTEGFQAVDKRARLYRRSRSGARPAVHWSWQRRSLPSAGCAARPRSPSLESTVYRAIAERFAPAVAAVDAAEQVRFLHGDVQPFLNYPAGELSREISRMVHPGLRIHLHAALRRAVRDGIEVVNRAQGVSLREGEAPVDVRLTVTPAQAPGEDGMLYLVGFQALTREDGGEQPEAEQVQSVPHLELELDATREELEQTVRELAIANEELQTANEEALSGNEELQSTNEELETSKEELQSLNEELNTVNAELQHKVGELEEAKDDVVNLLHSANLAILHLDPELRIRWFSHAAPKVLSLIDGDVGRPLADLNLRVADQRLLADARAVLEDFAARERELETEAGSHLLRRILPYRTHDKRVEGVIVTFTDLTAVRLAEQSAARAEAHMDAVLDAVSDAFLTLDGGWHCSYANPAAARLLNTDGAPVVGRSVWELLPTSFRGKLRMQLLASVGGRESRRFEIFVPQWDRWFACTAYPLEEGVALLLADVSARKREGLRRERLAQVLDESGYWEAALPDNQRLPEAFDVSPGYHALVTGAPAADGKRLALEGHVHPDDLPRLRAALEAVVRGENDQLDCEYRVQPADGREVWLHAFGTLAEDTTEGRLLAGLVLNISERKGHEQTAARLATIAAASPDALIATELDGTVNAWNRAASRLYGYSAGEVLGRSYLDLLPEEEREQGRRLLEASARGGTSSLESSRVGAGGRELTVMVNIAPIVDEEQRVVGLTIVEHDITARKRDEDALRRYSRSLEESNADLERFTYSVSHDLRAPLRAINGFAAMLEESLDAGEPPERQLLTRIQDNSRRMDQLLRDLLEFHRVGRSELRPTLVDMERIAGEALNTLASATERPACITLPPMPPVHGDVVLLGQVWANLIGNAFKYSSTRERPSIVIDGRPNGDEQVFMVRDNGVGFDMAHADKLFGSFERLHAHSVFEGTGMGLAITERILQRHGGRIWAEGRPDQGATFYFSLPRHGAGVAGHRERTPREAPTARRAAND